MTIPALILLSLAAARPAEGPRLMPAVVEVREEAAPAPEPETTRAEAPKKPQAPGPKLAPARRVKPRPGHRTHR